MGKSETKIHSKRGFRWENPWENQHDSYMTSHDAGTVSQARFQGAYGACLYQVLKRLSSSAEMAGDQATSWVNGFLPKVYQINWWIVGIP